MNEYPPIYTTLKPVPRAVNPPSHGTPLTNDDLAALLTRWQFERNSYPGWIVPSEEMRRTVWHNTVNWSRQIIEYVSSFPASDRILVYRELNWRFEASMVPLFPEQIEPFRKVIAELFDGLHKHEHVSPQLEWLFPHPNGSPDVLDSWVEIAFALMREARETYNADYWMLLDKQLAELIAPHKQYADRYKYESILWKIWNVERSAAKTIVSRWQPSSVKPLASLWKAGLLAELNEFSEARDILNRTLLEIRKAEQLQGQNIELFSAEGWCMYLLAAVEWCIDPKAGSFLKREFLERWQELKLWDCDPFEIKQSLNHALSGPAPKEEEGSQLKYHFDPGHVSRSHSMSFSVDPYLPAFAYIRFFEQSGMPMYLQWLNLAGKQLKTACLWISPFIPFWSPALLIRANALNLLFDDESILTRIEIAKMDLQLVNQLYQWSLNIWDRETTNLTVSMFTVPQKDLLLACIAELLSRLSFRLDEQQLRECFSRAVALQPWCGHSGYKLNRACRNWFLRLFHAAEQGLLLEWLPLLLSAPLVQHIGSSGNEWFDAMQTFPSKRVAEAILGADSENKIEQSVDWLLKRATSDTGSVRNRALYRLVMLYHSKKLNSAKCPRLAEALWSERAEDGLPVIQWISSWQLELLPCPPEVNLSSLLKRNILAMNPLTGGSIICHPNGSVSFQFPGTSVSDLIIEAANNTKTLLHVFGEFDGSITWTSSEAEHLLQGARKWWNFAKKACEKPTELFSIDKSDMGNLIARFLIRIAVPLFDEADDKWWRDLLDWFEEMRSTGVYISQVFPYVMTKRREEGKFLADLLLQDLTGQNEDAIAAAADALRHIIVMGDNGKFTPDSSHLKHSLVERVAFRRQTGLDQCLARVTQLLIQSPSALIDAQMNILITSLTAWLEQLSLYPTGSQEFPLQAIPNYRQRLGFLAGVLSTLAIASEQPSEPVPITQWRIACANDPMPEVRRAFSEASELIEHEQRPSSLPPTTRGTKKRSPKRKSP